ncbi:MAG: gamma-glutamyl-gamma-aminobutyrate hydrolase family protein [Myxococcota bacterium]
MKHHGHPRRPSIGITPDYSEPSTTQPFAKYDLKAAYADAVLRAGGLPFVLPYSDDRAVIDCWLDRISGLVITGGAFDIAPEHYGETAREGMGPVKAARTTFELALLKAALQRHLPILGVCGGMQLLNVAFGGTLYQDIAREVPAARPHEQSHDRTQPQHPVEVKADTALADCVGKGQLMVNSTHHQAVRKVGEGLIASAHSPDGLVEAVEQPGPGAFVVGVQWHPELMIDSVPPQLGLYKALVHRARERRH